MANILTQKLKYKRRQVSNDNANLTTFFLESLPAYIPAVGQTVLVSHTDLPAGDSGIKNKIITAQTNVFSAKFYSYKDSTSSPVDGYTYFFVLQYDDPTLGGNLGAGSTCGVIEFSYNPENYNIMKPVEASVIVQEQQLLTDNTGSFTKTLYGYKDAITSGTTTAIAPMLIVSRTNVNSPFSNLFKAFNLPVTDSEIAEFNQTQMGYLQTTTDKTNYDYVKDGIYYKWVASNTKEEVINPISGYTGTYYGTAYAGLCQQYQSATYNDILVMEIPHSNYGEIIDGKSVKVRIPKNTSGGYYEIYSAYQENNDLFTSTGLDSFLSENGFLATNFGVGLPTELIATTTTNTATTTYSNYQSNIALLFCDDIRRPNNDSTKSWSTGWNEMMADANRKVYTSTASVQKERFKLYDDICVGIAYLDKGFVVITNPLMVETIKNSFKTAGLVHYGDAAYTGTDTSAKLITNYITGTSNIDYDNTQFLLRSATSGCTVQYRSYNTEKSLNVVCLASTDEFFKTTNPTAKALVGVSENVDYADLKNDTNNLYPVIITEVGLHDAEGNLLAICKPTTPIKKYWYDVVSFNIRIRL